MVVTYANVVALIVAVLFGVLALSEPLPQVVLCAVYLAQSWLRLRLAIRWCGCDSEREHGCEDPVTLPTLAAVHS